MKRKFKSIENIEFELDIEKGDCDECYYYGLCCQILKDPFDINSEDSDFQDFCFENIAEDEDETAYRPKKETLEKNIPLIFPDIIYDKIISEQKIEHDISSFCDSYCLDKCIEDCPLKKYKNGDKKVQ